MSETSSYSGTYFTTSTQESVPTYRWIFHGNIVVPTGNPFRSTSDDNDDGDDATRSFSQQQQQQSPTSPSSSSSSSSVIWLGPGLKLCRRHVLAVDYDGKIAHFSHQDNFDTHLFKKRNYVRLGRREFLVPGFIDLHIHAPQFAYTGTATDRPLMGPNGWLETYTFPSESSLKDNLAKAHQVYETAVKTTLQSGTTTACYFATLDVDPCKVLVDVALNLGQRALVGKVCMDRNSPDSYCQDTKQNISETRELIEYIHRKAGREDKGNLVLPIVLPIVTPRFIPTCSPELLSELGAMARHYGCHIQSHISESIDEVEFSLALDQVDHKEGSTRTDATIFDSHGLLSDRCIMAHGVHLNDQDLDLLRQRGTAVAHCPLSNFFFAGGNLSCRKLMTIGNKVGLGTDVAGGYSPSMMNSSRMAVVAAKSQGFVEQEKEKTKEQQGTADTDSICETDMDWRHAFYLATLGGAEALGLSHRIGTFAVGMELDAFVLSASVRSPVVVFDTDTVPDIFQKLCTNGDDRNVKRVFVQGREVMKDGMVLYEI